MVGGPTSQNGDYNDSVQDYTANEVTLDYNATLVGASAGLYSVYKTGTPDTSIVGVDNVPSGNPDVPTSSTVTTQTTTTTQKTNTTTTTTSNSTPSSSGKYSISPNQSVTYDKNATDKMVGFEWSQFNIPAGEKVTKVEVKISSKNGGEIGKWQGAFGSSTSVAPGYWSQGDDMEQTISGSSGTITWNMPSSIADIAQYQYGGQLKFGTWWIDCQDFVINDVIVYTGSGSSATTTTTSSKPGNTTTTTTTSKPSTSSGSYEIKPNQQVVYDKNATDKMIGFDWSQFNIPSTEKVKKVEITISSNSGQIGKWQGAFGSSTSVAPGYWAQGDDMEQTISGNRGTITWNVPSSISDVIQYQYGGQLKFGTWWIDCGNFTVESIKVTTDGSSQTTTTTTTKITTTTTTTKPSQSGSVKYGDSNTDGSVTIADAVLIMQSLANSDEYKLTSQGMINADVVGNDGITAKDALAIQMVVAGTLNSLPIDNLD